jgi:ubiquinone/menaquinone biosynthesis C-methylase UbiE
MDFEGTEQGGELIIFSSLYKKYWEIGFKTHLYDLLSPEVYKESLQRVADFITLEKGEWVLDVGCGSGSLLPQLTDRLTPGKRYLGIDILQAGLVSLKPKANRLNLEDVIFGIKADLSKRFPLGDASVSCVAAHFSIYTLPEEKDRRHAYQEIFRVVKPGGLLVTANPTHSYNAKQIIRASLESLRSQRRPSVVKKYVLYPLTLHLGLKHIENQLRTRRWHGYKPEELCDQVKQAGFSIEHTEAVYGESGFLVVARKL